MATLRVMAIVPEQLDKARIQTENRKCRNCGGPVWGRTNKGTPRQVCKRYECRNVPRVGNPVYRYEQELLAKAKEEALDKPLRTQAERQALADQDEQIALAQLRALAEIGNPHAAKALLDHSARLLDKQGEDAQDWLAESPSEATDSR